MSNTVITFFYPINMVLKYGICNTHYLNQKRRTMAIAMDVSSLCTTTYIDESIRLLLEKTRAQTALVSVALRIDGNTLTVETYEAHRDDAILMVVSLLVCSARMRLKRRSDWKPMLGGLNRVKRLLGSEECTVREYGVE